jgi:hypothetical protein
MKNLHDAQKARNGETKNLIFSIFFSFHHDDDERKIVENCEYYGGRVKFTSPSNSLLIQTQYNHNKKKHYEH